MKRILITGGASGLGKALAYYYSQQGWKVCITDIQCDLGISIAQKIESQTGNTVEYLSLDVTNDQQWKEVVAWLEKHWKGLDCIINNAGVAAAGPIEKQSIDDWQWLFNINIFGVARGCHFCTPMLKRSRGKIINVSSMAGMLHLASMGAYNSAKAAVIALSETLEVELKGDNVSVSVVCPAFFKSGLSDSMRCDMPGSARAVEWLMNQSKLDATNIAKIIYNRSNNNVFYILPHRNEKIIWIIKRLFPTIARRLLYGASQKLEKGFSDKKLKS